MCIFQYVGGEGFSCWIHSLAMFLENCSRDQKILCVVIKVMHSHMLLRMGTIGGRIQIVDLSTIVYLSRLHPSNSSIMLGISMGGLTYL